MEVRKKLELDHFGVLQHSPSWPYKFLNLFLTFPSLPDIQLLLGQLVTKIILSEIISCLLLNNIFFKFLKYLKI